MSDALHTALHVALVVFLIYCGIGLLGAVALVLLETWDRFRASRMGPWMWFTCRLALAVMNTVMGMTAAWRWACGRWWAENDRRTCEDLEPLLADWRLVAEPKRKEEQR